MHKAVVRKTGHILAVKQVPVDTDLQEIIKEISIMQQCDSAYVVRYYGSYFKDSDLLVGPSKVFLLVKGRFRSLWSTVAAAVCRI